MWRQRARTVAVLPALLSLSDVAALAQVQRPVVSMWRRRPRVGGVEYPFPVAVSAAGGEERFAANDVVVWLERTGRGNNPQARADALAHARLPVLWGADLIDGTTALLCLKSLTGAALTGLIDDELLDLAEEADPDDELLFEEIDRLGETRRDLARYADELADAAYDIPGALDRVLRRRPTMSATALARPVRDLVGSLVAAMAVDLESERVRLCDASGGASDLVAEAVAAIGDRIDCVVVVLGYGSQARMLRRVGVIRGWSLRHDLSGNDPAVILGQFPNATAPEMTAAQLLAAVDDLQLELLAAQRALVVGPAAVLCDRLADAELDAARDQIVRLGRLRCAVRLPKALLPGRSRQALGLWALGPDSAPRVEDKWIATADLTDRALTADVVDDLVTDVVASLRPRDLGRAHAFRFARLSSTATLLAGRGPLVPFGVRPPSLPLGSSAETVLRARDLLAAVSAPPLPNDLKRFEIGPGEREVTAARTVTLQDAIAGDRARMIPGFRLSDSLAPGSVRVIGVADLDPTAPATPRAVDPLDLEARHPRARRTEPGDVVFCVSPRPRAIVDRQGLSVVESRARVLRCLPASGLSPDVVSRTINSLPDAAHHWRAWRLPVMPEDQIDPMGAALRAVDAATTESRRRIEHLDELAQLLVTGAASGALTVTVTSEQPTEKGH